MDSGTVSYDDETYTDTYWRRRAIALGTILLTVGAIAWSCQSDDKRIAAVKNAALSTPTAAPSSGVTPTTTAPTNAGPVLPTVTVTVTQEATVEARKPGDACRPNEVVVNMAPVKGEFAKGEMPQFALTVVNTGQLDCTFDVGAKRLVTRIQSGSDKIWASAHCDPTSGSSIQMLKRGIPYASGFAWDRKRAREGCEAPRDKALPGTYTVQAQGGGVKTKKTVFVLR